MRKYIIIDNLGKRHATIKAENIGDAIKKYLPKNINSRNNIVMAVLWEDLESFKKNIESL